MMKIEVNQDEEIYRISDGADAALDYGEEAWFVKDGEHYFAFIDSAGATDGHIYQVSAGIKVEVEMDCEFDTEGDETAANE
jgi:hypothetical protein